MITIRRSEERGKTNFGWLDSKHSFSFGRYYDPDNMHYGPLRVLNEDFVEPGGGFPEHPHDNMEIITYIIEGALEHKDSMGTNEVIYPGEIQKMSAGTGIYHSEFNHSNKESVHLTQIWIVPDTRGLPPSYEQKKFSDEEKKNKLLLVASNEKKDDLVHIQQDAKMYVSKLESGKEIEYPINAKRGIYLFLIKGNLKSGEELLYNGDAAMVNDEEKFVITAENDSEFLLFDVLIN